MHYSYVNLIKIDRNEFTNQNLPSGDRNVSSTVLGSWRREENLMLKELSLECLCLCVM